VQAKVGSEAGDLRFSRNNPLKATTANQKGMAVVFLGERAKTASHKRAFSGRLCYTEKHGS
jgi:hypothetical protein